MKPILLILAIYSLIYHQYQKRESAIDKPVTLKAGPAPKPSITKVNKADTLVTISKAPHNILANAALITAGTIQ